MPKTFIIERDYEMDADAHFAEIVKFDELAEAMSNQVTYFGMPEGEATPGQSIDLNMIMYGWLPIGRWHIDVIERDDAARRLVSHERGTLAKRHDHILTVEPLEGGGCRHRDEITVDAGFRTSIYAWTAKRVYEKRHRTRAKLRGQA